MNLDQLSVFTLKGKILLASRIFEDFGEMHWNYYSANKLDNTFPNQSHMTNNTKNKKAKMFKHLMLSDLQQHVYYTNVYRAKRIYVLQYIKIHFIFKW